MNNIAWILVKCFFIFPVLGALCGATLAHGSFCNSTFHKVLGVLGIIVMVILLKVLVLEYS